MRLPTLPSTPTLELARVFGVQMMRKISERAFLGSCILEGGDDGDVDGQVISSRETSMMSGNRACYTDHPPLTLLLGPRCVRTYASISLPPEAEILKRDARDCEVRYDIRDTWVGLAEAVPEIAPMHMGEDSRSRISQRVDMDSQLVDLLMGDRMTLQEIVWMVEEEAYASRKDWPHSIGLSQATHQELQTHRNHVYANETHLQAHQTQLQLQGTLIQTQHQIVETLRVMRDMRREMGDMQIELLALRGQRRARQPAPDARILDHQDALGDADSHV
ncbi:hypothetical protein Tco_1084144 [Tanacetum coccineum]